MPGPNGAGKSTTAPPIVCKAFGIEEFVNADMIAQGLSVLAPETAAFRAGRVMLTRILELAGARKSGFIWLPSGQPRITQLEHTAGDRIIPQGCYLSVTDDQHGHHFSGCKLMNKGPRLASRLPLFALRCQGAVT